MSNKALRPPTVHVQTRRAVSYALRCLDLMEKLEPTELIEVGSILSVLIQVEIARKNARKLNPEDEQ